MFFGSALSNFGLEPFLRGLTEFAPPPQPRPSSAGTVDPADPDFSGFVFKIQANMNPRHRDRIAFVRVCSGVLSKDMQVTNTRLNAPVRLSRPNRFFGRERETVDSAVAGDVVGLVNPGRFAIGDTLWAGRKLAYPPIPHFAAEFFAAVRLRDTRYKQFEDGVRQLEEEGLMQVVFPIFGRREPILGVVGALQFDVVAARLKSEYGVECDIDRLKYTIARWVTWPDDAVDDRAEAADPGRAAVGRSRRAAGAALRVELGAAVPASARTPRRRSSRPAARSPEHAPDAHRAPPRRADQGSAFDSRVGARARRYPGRPHVAAGGLCSKGMNHGISAPHRCTPHDRRRRNRCHAGRGAVRGGGSGPARR